MQRSAFILFAFLGVLLILSTFTDARRRRRNPPPPPPPPPAPRTPAQPAKPALPIVTLSDQQVWNKYRARLAYEVAKRQCGGGIDCDLVRGTEFQFITTPTSAHWHEDPQTLHKDVCGFAPAWDVSYKPKTTSHDGIFSEMYKKFLLESKNLAQYKNFMAQQPTKDDQFYQWQENGLTLNSFINTCRARNGQVGFSFNININSEETPSNSWARLGGYGGSKSFIRTYTATDKPAADAEKIELNAHFDAEADSEFIFGRGRTVYHHVYQTRKVAIKTNKFDFKMEAVDLAAINVSPSNSWFNKPEFMNNKQLLSQLGYSGAGGKMPLMPSQIIVAYRPKVEIVVSKTVYEQIHAQIKDTATLGWLVGGAKFLSPQVKALHDDGSVEFFTEEEKRSGKAAQMADEIRVERINQREEEFFRGNSDLERYFDETSKYAQLAADSEFNTERVSSDSETESDSAFLFRRRTRHRTVVHVTTEEIPEGDYRITWVSNNDVPQILGVISERL